MLLISNERFIFLFSNSVEDISFIRSRCLCTMVCGEDSGHVLILLLMREKLVIRKYWSFCRATYTVWKWTEICLNKPHIRYRRARCILVSTY